MYRDGYKEITVTCPEPGCGAKRRVRLSTYRAAKFSAVCIQCARKKAYTKEAPPVSQTVRRDCLKCGHSFLDLRQFFLCKTCRETNSRNSEPESYFAGGLVNSGEWD